MANIIILFLLLLAVILVVMALRPSGTSKKPASPTDDLKHGNQQPVNSTNHKPNLTGNKPVPSPSKTVAGITTSHRQSSVTTHHNIQDARPSNNIQDARPSHNIQDVRPSHNIQDARPSGTAKQMNAPDFDNFQEASTILGVTRVIEAGITRMIEGREEPQAKNILIAYNVLVGNIGPSDIKSFCQKRPILSVKRSEGSNAKTPILEFVDDEPCGEAEIWASPQEQKGRYYVLPNALIRLRYSSFTDRKNSQEFGKTFDGIMQTVFQNKFELIQLAIAEQHNDTLVIVSKGKIGLPIDSIRR